MANPKPTAAQLGMIVAGAVGAGALTLVAGLGGMIGGAIIGVGAAVGAIPYSRAIQQHKKQKGD